MLVLLLFALACDALPNDYEPEFGTCTSTGVSVNPPLCTAASPCTNLLPTYLLDGDTEIDKPDSNLDLMCSDGVRNDGLMREIVVGGVTRYFCKYKPAGNNLPVVVYFHGSGADATHAYDKPKLRLLAETEVVRNGTTGFMLIAPHARNRHWPSTLVEDGSKWNHIQRRYDGGLNDDFLFIDTLLDSLVASGEVDPLNIHMMGHSNGAMFSQAYTLWRYNNPTPMGNRVRSAAVYSANDPFGSTSTADDASCDLVPYPQSNAPVYMIHRDCDIWPCERVRKFYLEDLPTRMGNSRSFLRIVTRSNRDTQQECCCSGDFEFCLDGIQAHTEWPTPWTADMLRFLRHSPLFETAAPTTASTTTQANPTSAVPTTLAPTTFAPTTLAPTSNTAVAGGTFAPTTLAPTTVAATVSVTTGASSRASIATFLLLVAALLC